MSRLFTPPLPIFKNGKILPAHGPRIRLVLAGLLLLLAGLPARAQSEPVLVADLTLNAPDAAAMQTWRIKNPKAPLVFSTNHYGFQKGDVLLLNLENQKGKGTYTLEIVDYASNSPVFSTKQIKKLKNVRLPITHKAVYTFVLSADASEANTNTCHFTLRRVPAHDSVRTFNPHVTWITRPDTTWSTVTERVLVKSEIIPQTLLDKQFRVEAKANFMSSNRTAVKFQLPKNTSHWVYWVGVGQEPVVQLNDITKQFSKMAASVLAGSNPVIAFGMGLLPYLPQLTTGGNIDYYFLNKVNADLFVKEGQLKTYGFASGQKIVSDYLKVPAANTPKTDDGHLYMGFQNNNTITALDITLKVVAFTTEQKFETRQVRKPTKITQTKVPVFGD